MASGQVASNLLVMVVTFIFAAFFVAAEFALVQSRPSALEEMIDNGEGNRAKLKRALNMVHRLNEYLSTTQVGTSVCGIILGWIGEETVEFLLIDLMQLTHLQLPQGGLHAAGAVIGVLILTYLEVVITEIVPKNISIDIPIKVLMLIVTPLHYFHLAFYPFVWLLNTSANGLVRLMGMKPADEGNEAFSQAEILNLSKAAVTTGDMDQNDVTYMQRAFDLNDKTAHDIMVDRTSLVVINIEATVHEVIRDYLQEGYSRFPVVADGDKDKVLGYVYIYDLVKQAQVDDTVRVSKLLRAMITVPEATPIHNILQQMIKKQTPIVVVVDEYGGTSGIVTDKDIYEELFGTVKDEIDDVSDEYIIKTDQPNVYKISGKTTLYDFERFFHTNLRQFQESDIVTIAGFLMEDHPDLRRNDSVVIDRFNLTVTDYSRGFANWFEVTVGPEIPRTMDVDGDGEEEDLPQQ
ncbi:MAG: hemolysin family protein [Lactobacillus sp.]|mgnify:CR=1 FL=1|jgi:CBS domain containing-hemolysin-like protein|uniref:Hemolysin family protein n=1 Tax=Lacticaseibacillus suilingensis TaxID=2799577 RepID=A0ABW4BGI2_9LACO|nr:MULTISPECIES: hemolysin family protein [Lacticaseibacillus]MCI1893157.1 hemolysin family protein [Lactobacillus sp.]MCI1917366.1 hemolysin family protein [Lactobacillus sp.]MCI1940893.1 hemolysin family protein [Lactobacillus sp.]MCI1971272.1 hemolysin family protein [Lactobacillus sp.]MCI2016983.1 hemolysin family protein [Lactobacillus sp.]